MNELKSENEITEELNAAYKMHARLKELYDLHSSILWNHTERQEAIQRLKEINKEIIKLERYYAPGDPIIIDYDNPVFYE